VVRSMQATQATLGGLPRSRKRSQKLGRTGFQRTAAKEAMYRAARTRARPPQTSRLPRSSPHSARTLAAISGLSRKPRAIASSTSQYGEQVIVAPARFETLGLDAAPGGRLLLEEVEGQAAQHGEVLGGVADAHPALILTKGHVEQPVDLVFNAPMGAHRFPETLGRERSTQQIVARFPLAVAVGPAALGLHDPQRA